MPRKKKNSNSSLLLIGGLVLLIGLVGGVVLGFARIKMKNRSAGSLLREDQSSIEEQFEMDGEGEIDLETEIDMVEVEEADIDAKLDELEGMEF